jgi:hypothetical protein
MAITSFRAVEAISAGDAVSLNTAGLLLKANAAVFEQASTIGIAVDSGATGSLIRVNTDCIYNGYTSLTPGVLLYLSVSTSGGLTDYSGWESELSASLSPGAFLTSVGRAITPTSLDVEVSKPIYIEK